MKQKKCSRENEAGFSLIEVVIAIAFLSTIAIAVGQALLTGQKNSQEIIKDATVLANCEDIMRQMSIMDMETLANQNGTTFTVDGVNGTGTISVTRPYMGSEDIARVVLYWNGNQVLEGAFGNAAMIPTGQ